MEKYFVKDSDYIKSLISDDSIALCLLRVLHPKEFDDYVIELIAEDYQYSLGLNYSYVINKVVDIYKNIIKYNVQSKTLYTLQKEPGDQLILSWKETSKVFNNYLLLLFDRLIPVLVKKTDEEPKILTKLITELRKLCTTKAIEEIYNKISYMYHSENTNDFTYDNKNILIFQNGYMDLDTGSFTESIIKKFDEDNQCMNIRYNNNPVTSLSKDINLEYMFSRLNKIVHNHINKSITLLIGPNTNMFINKVNNLFGTYIQHVNIKDYYKNDYNKKLIVIDSPDEIDLNKLNNNIHNKQHILLCCGNKTPKFTNVIDLNELDIFNINTSYFDMCNIDDLFADIMSYNNELNEPFSVNIIKENILCECNSAEYFTRACINYDDNTEMFTEQDIYKKYLSFCKSNKLSICTVTTLINILQSKNINVDGDIGSRVFNGFSFK